MSEPPQDNLSETPQADLSEPKRTVETKMFENGFRAAGQMIGNAFTPAVMIGAPAGVGAFAGNHAWDSGNRDKALNKTAEYIRSGGFGSSPKKLFHARIPGME